MVSFLLIFYQKLAKPDKTFELGCGKPANRRLSCGDAVAQPPTLNDSFVCFVGFVTLIIFRCNNYTKNLAELTENAYICKVNESITDAMTQKGCILYLGSRGGTVEKDTCQPVVSSMNAKQIAQGEGEVFLEGGEV